LYFSTELLLQAHYFFEKGWEYWEAEKGFAIKIFCVGFEQG